MAFSSGERSRSFSIASTVSGVCWRKSRFGAFARMASPVRPSKSVTCWVTISAAVRNMLGVYGERVESTEREVSALRAQLQETRKKLEETGQKNASALEKLLQE